MNVVVPDTGEIYFVEMSNGNLSNGKVDSEKEADATLYLNKADITQMLLGNTDLTALLRLKQAGIKGITEVLTKLQDSLVDFDTSFEIVPRPAKGKEVDANLYQHKH